MVSLFLSNVIVTCVFLLSILGYNPCHIPLEYRCLLKTKCLIKARLPWLQISTESNYVSNSFLASSFCMNKAFEMAPCRKHLMDIVQEPP